MIESALVFLTGLVISASWLWIALVVATRGRPYWPETRALLARWCARMCEAPNDGSTP